MLARQRVAMTRDPIELEIFKNIFHSIAEEMGAALRRTAFSPNIKERRDYSCAVFDDRAGGIENRAGVVAPLPDVRGKGSAAQGRAHLLGDGVENIFENFQLDGIDAH